MIADLLLAIAIASSPASGMTQTAQIPDPVAATTVPTAMAGPIHVRFRTPAGMVQVPAHAIRVDGMDRAPESHEDMK